MGNHEYCVDCGESDFHRGRPCNPEKLAAETSRMKKAEDRSMQYSNAARRVCQKLVALGYPARIGEYGNVVINKWELEAWTKEENFNG